MASVGNVRLMSYRAAAAGLLLFFLIIMISGSVEGIGRITTHHLTAAGEMTRACLAAILEHNNGEMLKRDRAIRSAQAQEGVGSFLCD
ncbi:hypothetical protein AXF42_Ash018142 [Apostasia shenzhenica]|uniref:Uncharacterized protein n=1 Tax=Apostasia shenzhenica TaxID=1088818 RepID=A0A2I0AF01_9ASPA|nr:hypothetical protein AXF42_Ash018142 [Apostasia shenzhenica]